MSNDVVSRIKELMSYYSINSLSLSKELGYKSSEKISRLFRDGGAKPSYDIIYDIANKFEINTDWLITGRGSMLKSKSEFSPEETYTDPAHGICYVPPTAPINAGTYIEPEVNYEYKGAPYFNVDFIGGFDLVLNDQTRNPDYYINFEPYNKDGVIWCNITGHSMEPELNSGDYIAMKEMTSPIEYLPSGEIYGIVTDDYRTVKRICPAEKKGFVRLIPTNKSPEYSPQEIPVSMIRKVYAVLGSMHRLF